MYMYNLHWLNVARPIAVKDLDAGVELQLAAQELCDDTVVFR